MAQQRRPFTAEDLFLHRKITAACAGAASAVCVVKSADRESDGYRTHLWEFAFDGSQGRQLTHGPGSNSLPRWSPDGARLAFVSTREGGQARIHVLECSGGDARPLSQAPAGIVDIAWTPDGAFLLATAALPVDPDLRGERGSAPKTESLAEVAWKLPYKTDGVGYMLGREIHLFKIDARTGESRQLTDGPFDVYGFDVSPDHSRIAYTRSSGGRFAHRSELWTCDIDGGSHKRAACELATVLQPVWSPDGQRLVFAGAALEGDAQSRFWLLDAATGDVSPLGAEDVEPASGQRYYWKADGSAVVFVRAWRGRHHPALISVPGGALAEMTGPDRQLSAFDGTETRMVYSVDHPALPSELWVRWIDGSGERKLSSFNTWWDERTEIQAEIRSFHVPDGSGGSERIEGWLITAKDRQGPGPLLDDPHGGPAAYALMDYDTNVYWQALCSQGWAVLALNPVGSASYGPQFCARLRARWGELDLPQHEAAIRALRSEGICDDRVAIAGKSYGGFFTAYAVGHSKMFKAAVVMAPVGNIESHYGTADGGFHVGPLFMGKAPAFDRERARALSPVTHIHKATTPTLFMQGKDDDRCPKHLSEELYVNLMRAGETPTELVLYRGQDHHFLNDGAPSCRQDAARRIMKWLATHVVERSTQREDHDQTNHEALDESVAG